jgi:nicotinamide-nucleotide amidase
MAEADSIAALARSLVNDLTAAGKTVATAESCTGGWIAKAITDVAGSSRCFAYGIVSYGNDAKETLLGVAPSTLAAQGAVSEATVREMAEGVLALSHADAAVAVSGIAGPGGGTPEKPVGTVWFGWSVRAGGTVHTDASMLRLDGDRAGVRSRAVAVALQGLSERVRRRG